MSKTEDDDYNIGDLHIADTSCCGMDELQNIQYGEGIDENDWGDPSRYRPVKPWCLMKRIKDHGIAAVFVFSTARYKNSPQYLDPNAGLKLARYVHKHGLGKVIRTKETLNSNSGNLIRSFLWCVDQKALNHFNPEENKK